MNAVFYDTWAFVALADVGDAHHGLARNADEWLEHGGYVAVTSDYVLDETLTLLNAAGGAHTAIAFIDGILARAEAQDLLIAEVGRGLREDALKLFKKIAPSERRLSFTDCTSFVVMRDVDCELAFTADRHFHRGGSGIRPLFERDKTGHLSFVPPPR